MSHIYWELHEIPRPEESYINHSDGRVFLISDDGHGNKKRKVIGRATSETTMHPNDLFRYLYPNLWSECYGDQDMPEHELHTGMYALTLGIGFTGMNVLINFMTGAITPAAQGLATAGRLMPVAVARPWHQPSGS